MYALIDGDIVAFRAAASAENDNRAIAIYRTGDMLERILRDTGATHFQIYLSPDKNWRHELYPAYKANRVRPRPRWLNDCKEHLAVQWGGTLGDFVEADDLLGIAMGTVSADLYPFIATIDKDLQQIPGDHYNLVTGSWTHVTVLGGCYNFWRHVLVGDSSDNVPGCPGVGPVKADRLLEGCQTDDEMFRAVRARYGDDAALTLTASLIWVMRQEGEQWNPANYFGREPDVTSVSTPATAAAIDPSTDPTTQEVSYGFLQPGDPTEAGPDPSIVIRST